MTKRTRERVLRQFVASGDAVAETPPVRGTARKDYTDKTGHSVKVATIDDGVKWLLRRGDGGA